MAARRADRGPVGAADPFPVLTIAGTCYRVIDEALVPFLVESEDAKGRKFPVYKSRYVAVWVEGLRDEEDLI